MSKTDDDFKLVHGSAMSSVTSGALTPTCSRPRRF